MPHTAASRKSAQEAGRRQARRGRKTPEEEEEERRRQEERERLKREQRGVQTFSRPQGSLNEQEREQLKTPEGRAALVGAGKIRETTNLPRGGGGQVTREQVSRESAQEGLIRRESPGGLLPEERREAFQEVSGSGQLTEELQNLILEPPSLKPPTRKEKGLPIAPTGALGTTQLPPGTTIRESLLKGALPAAAIVAAVATLPASLPFVASQVARISIPKAIIGAGSATATLKTITAGLGVFLVGPKILDFRGDEMDNLRTQLQKVVEDGERIEAANRNGFPSGDTIELLTTMAEEVAAAESRIQELGLFNLNYRVSKDYDLDQQRVRSSREALLRRVIAVENTAATGQAALRPEELLFNVEQIEEAS